MRQLRAQCVAQDAIGILELTTNLLNRAGATVLGLGGVLNVVIEVVTMADVLKRALECGDEMELDPFDRVYVMVDV